MERYSIEIVQKSTQMYKHVYKCTKISRNVLEIMVICRNVPQPPQNAENCPKGHTNTYIWMKIYRGARNCTKLHCTLFFSIRNSKLTHRLWNFLLDPSIPLPGILDMK